MKIKALALGEVLWDIIGDQKHLGGAVFNLIAHMTKINCEAKIITSIGNDAPGREILHRAKTLNIDSSLIQTDLKHPTGSVLVNLEEGIPTYEISECVAYDHIEFSDDIKKYLKQNEADVFCFGTLAQRNRVSRNTLNKILKTGSFKRVFFDINLRQEYFTRKTIMDSLEYSTILKLNDDEIEALENILELKETSEEEIVEKISGLGPVRTICITRGSKGCTIYHDRIKKEIEGMSVNAIDTVGAGDAFSAAFLKKYIETDDPFESAKIANHLGAYVASKPGAIPEYSDEIKKVLF